MARRKRGTVANKAQTPGEAAAAAGAPPESVQAAPTVVATTPSAQPATPPGAPGQQQLQNAFAGLTGASPVPTGTNGSPFSQLTSPGQVEVSQGLGGTSPGPTESAIRQTHSANPVIPHEPSSGVIEKGIVQVLGDIKSLNDSFAALGKKTSDGYKETAAALNSLNARVEGLEKSFASNLAVVLNEVKELAKAAASAAPTPPASAPASYPPAPATPSPQPPQVAAPPAPGQQPGQAQVPARAQQIAQAVCVMLQNHYSVPGAVQISIHQPQHQLALVQAAQMGNIQFNVAGDAGLDPGCRQEVINALKACQKVDAEGIVRP